MMGVVTADVVKVLVLVVHSAAAWVPVPSEPGTKMGHWDGPLHRRCPNDSKTGHEWKTSS